MKYLIRYLIVFSFILITGKSYSQFHFGVKGGIGFNNIRESEEIFANKNLTSVHFGIFAKIKLIENLQLIPELQYITKGYSIKDNTGDYKVKISYAELPVLVNYKIVKWLSVEAGPSLGIKINARSVSGSSKSSLINDYVEPIDFGVAGGFRLHPIEKLAFIARYNYGLSKVEEFYFNRSPDPDPIPAQKTYNRSIQLSVAYTIK